MRSTCYGRACLPSSLRGPIYRDQRRLGSSSPRRSLCHARVPPRFKRNGRIRPAIRRAIADARDPRAGGRAHVGLARRARALGRTFVTWRSRTPSVVAHNDSLIRGMLVIEGSRLCLRRLPSEVKMLMAVSGGLGAVGLTRQVASPPTSQAVGHPHLRKLSEVLDDNDVLGFHLRPTVHQIHGAKRALEKVPTRTVSHPRVTLE
jgi:hypothetical protein